MQNTNQTPNAFANQTVLITGGLGFIGSNLAYVLTQMNARVTIVDNCHPYSGGTMKNVLSFKDKLKIYDQDVRDKTAISRLVRGQKYIFHCAGLIDHIRSVEDPMDDFHNNAEASLSLLEACRVENPDAIIVYLSTRGVYGQLKKLPATEGTCPFPIDFNGINKLAAEYYHLLYFRHYGLRTTVLRLTNTYGPRQRLRRAGSGFLGHFIRQALSGKPIQIYDRGNFKRDFTYVWDVLDAMIRAAESERSDGQVYNIGGHSRSIRQVADAIQRLAGKNQPYIFIPHPEIAKDIEIGDFQASSKKIETDLGWTLKTSFEEGLKATMTFYKRELKNYL